MKRIKLEYIMKLRGRTDIKESLCKAWGRNLKWGMTGVRRIIRENKPDGKLTTHTALVILARGLDVPKKYLMEEYYEVNESRERDHVPDGTGQECL